MTSPNPVSPRRPSYTTSPCTGLLPSPFTHSDEALGDAPSARFSSTGGPDPPLYPPEDDYPEGSLLPPPTFAPLFTMITDKESGETYHPATYYVFSDDEADVISNGALHALESFTPQAVREAETKALLEGGVREEERYILVNMEADGMSVQMARSLAPSWAVTNAQVRAAPTFDGGDEGEGSEGLMLMVEGLSGSASAAAVSRSAKERLAAATDSFEEARKRSGGNMIIAMEELASSMIGGLRILDKVVATT